MHTAAIFLLSVILLTLSACDSKSENAEPERDINAPQKTNHQPATQSSSTPDPFWPLAAQKLESAHQNAQALSAQINQLLLEPSHQALENTRDLWRSTSAFYEGMYVFTRLATVDSQRFDKLLDAHRNVAAWPIQPGYLDSFGVHAYSGIVFDIGLPINEAVLREQHGMHDLADATLGLYALEFLLFGERSLRGHMAFIPVTGLSDTQKKQGFTSVDELPRNRRRALVLLQSQLLVKDLSAFSDQSHHIAEALNNLGTLERIKRMKQASHTMLTEHLLAMAEHSQGGIGDPETHLWSNQQLADRLLSQLQGLNDLLPLLFEQEPNPVQKAINAYAEEVAKIAQLPPLGPQGTPSAANWTKAHGAIKPLLQFFQDATSNSDATAPSKPAANISDTETESSENPAEAEDFDSATAPDKIEP